METGSMEVDETGSTEEVFSRPTVEYTTHEQYTMQMEREANRKLKAQIRKRKKLGFKKMMVGNITVIYRPWQHDC